MKYYKYFLYGVSFLTLPIGFSLFLYFNEKVFITNLTREIVSGISDNVAVNIENEISEFININSLSAFVAEKENDYSSWETAALSLHIQNPHVYFLWLKLVTGGINGRLLAENVSSSYWNEKFGTNQTDQFKYIDDNFETHLLDYNYSDTESDYWLLWDSFPFVEEDRKWVNLDFLSTLIKEDLLDIQNGVYTTVITQPIFLPNLNNRTNIRIFTRNKFTNSGENIEHIGLSYVPIELVGDKVCENLLPGLSIHIFSNLGYYLYSCEKTKNEIFVKYFQNENQNEYIYYTSEEIVSEFHTELSIVKNVNMFKNVSLEILIVPSEDFRVSSIISIIIPVSILLIILTEFSILCLIYNEKMKNKRMIQNVINVEEQLMKHICHEVLNPLHSVQYYVSISKCKCNVDLINNNLLRMAEVIESYKHKDSKIDIYKKCNIASIIRDITSQIENLKIRIHENVWCDYMTYPYIIKRFLIYLFLVYKPEDFLHFMANVEKKENSSKLIITIKFKNRTKKLQFDEFNKTLKKVKGEIKKSKKEIMFSIPIQHIEESV